MSGCFGFCSAIPGSVGGRATLPHAHACRQHLCPLHVFVVPSLLKLRSCLCLQIPSTCRASIEGNALYGGQL